MQLQYDFVLITFIMHFKTPIYMEDLKNFSVVILDKKIYYQYCNLQFKLIYNQFIVNDWLLNKWLLTLK